MDKNFNLSAEIIEKLLQRVSENEDDWAGWLKLSIYFYYNTSSLDESVECCNKFKEKIGKNFEITFSLRGKKTIAWFQINLAKSLLQRNLRRLAKYDMEDFFNSDMISKELYYAASKIYTSFYDEHIKCIKMKLFGYTAEYHYKIFHQYGDQKYLYENVYDTQTNDTYEIIDGHPIYYVILRDLYNKFGITYEQLSEDIKNKLL